MPSADSPPVRPDLAQRLCDADKRVRHVMHLLGSVTRLALDRAADLDLFTSHLEGRLGAMARAYGMLACRPRGMVDLHGLVADELIAHAAIEDKQFSLIGPGVVLRGSAAAVVWLVVHELVVNSIKFGALASGDGAISVTWHVQVNGTARLMFRWLERGGRIAPPDRRPGFGTEMIERRLARELGGTGVLAFTPNGLDCTISLPVGDDIRLQAAV